MISRQERIDMACDAEQLIAEAIENLKGAVRGLPCENRHRAYLICQLEAAIDAGDWASADSTVGDVIDNIESEAEDDDEPLSAVIAGRLEKAGYTVRIDGDWLYVSGAEERPDCMTVWDAAGRTVPRTYFAPTADGVNICLAYR
jgi:hypothetical protein